MQELKKLFDEMFFLAYMALSMRELSLRTGWLMSQDSLKQLVPLFENAVVFGNLLRLDQCSKSLSSCSVGSPSFPLSKAL